MEMQRSMKKYLKAECVFLILTKNSVLDCEGPWKKDRQQVIYHVPCFLSKNSLTCMTFLTIYVKNNEYLLTFNSIESLLSFVPQNQKAFITKVLNDCVVE